MLKGGRDDASHVHPSCSSPLILGLAVLAGCSGSDGDETAFTPVAGSDTAYCDAYRAWQVHELDGGEGNEQPNPAALRKYWNEYLIFEETLLHEAPPEIRDAGRGQGERDPNPHDPAAREVRLRREADAA